MKMLFLLFLLSSSVAFPQKRETVPVQPKFTLVKKGFLPTRTHTIDTLVIHSSYNALGGDAYSVEKLLALFAHYGVSSHYLIDRDGQIYQLVPESYRSFHAGASRMPDGRVNVNNFSLGIELMNTRDDQYTEAQYRSLRNLVVRLKKQHPIKHIVGHGQIAPTRRSDPWNFNWKKVEDLM
jgi:N-acetyl-anhydromuramyl-L-alanine amidase AmpD